MNIPLVEVCATLAAAGAVVGSFTATAVLRSLRAQPVIRGRSACDRCGRALAYTQTLPVISFLARRGACQTCSGPIDPAHLVGEMAGALFGLGVGLVVMLGTTSLVGGFALAVLGLSLLALSLIDLCTQRIPDALSASVLTASAVLACNAGLGVLVFHLVWAGGVFCLLVLVRALFTRARGYVGLGLGDVKLLSALAVWLGPITPYAVVLACLLALLARLATGQMRGRAAFGPWIALGGWVAGIAAGIAPWPV